MRGNGIGANSGHPKKAPKKHFGHPQRHQISDHSSLLCAGTHRSELWAPNMRKRSYAGCSQKSLTASIRDFSIAFSFPPTQHSGPNKVLDMTHSISRFTEYSFPLMFARLRVCLPFWCTLQNFYSQNSWRRAGGKVDMVRLGYYLEKLNHKQKNNNQPTQHVNKNPSMSTGTSQNVFSKRDDSTC